MKIKTYIRRIILFPFLFFMFPFVWLFSSLSFKEAWEESLDMTDEDTDKSMGEV